MPGIVAPRTRKYARLIRSTDPARTSTVPPTRIDPEPYRAIPGVEVYRIWPGHDDGRASSGLRVEVSGAAPAIAPAEREHTERAWTRLCAANPRLYSGPLLAVVSVDFDRGVYHCRRDEFKRLAVQPEVHTGVQLLSVTGVLTARDAMGRPHVLLGRRGEQTRVYPGMWELAPAGGVPPPHASRRDLGEDDLIAQLLDEGEEELGVRFERARVRPACLIARDLIAHSDDVTLEIAHHAPGSVELLSEAMRAPRAEHAWEYSQTRWVPLDTIRQFDDAFADEIIITTRATFRGLGWIEDL